MKILRRIKAFIRFCKSKIKLKRSGYSSWANYKHNRDKDVCVYANDVETFYHGYPYVFVCKPNPSHYAYHQIYDYGPGGSRYGYNEIKDWCEKHIRWHYRMDCHRVLETNYGMEFNDIGGWDLFFFAFKNEKDFTHFLLRWA